MGIIRSVQAANQGRKVHTKMQESWPPSVSLYN